MAGPHPLEARARGRVGTTLCGKWHIDRLLDVGGMAAVYAATHRNGNRVAVKVLHGAYTDHTDARRRFLREGYVANRVGHPGAVRVLDDDEAEDGALFLVMDLLEGMSLEARLSAQLSLSPPEVLYVAAGVLDVLGAAHERGIVHRDIKPGNIFLGDAGRVSVLDFGLARLREKSESLTTTRTGMVIGTASYMPPEQARAKRDLVDHRSDLWAVGATMFKALSGRHVHLGNTPNERLVAAMSEHAPSLAAVAPENDAEVVALVDRALAFQKGDRWPDARSMQLRTGEIFERLTGQPMPEPAVAVHQFGWDAARQPASTVADDDVHVSVVFDVSSGGGNSVIVEFEDEAGPPERFALRENGPLSGSDTIVEVTVVPLERDEN